MFLGRLLGWLLVLSAVLLLALEVVIWFSGGGFRLRTAGELWFALAPESLNLAQAVTQRHLLPELWDPGMIAILLLPAPLVLGGLGLLLMLLFRRRTRRRRGRY